MPAFTMAINNSYFVMPMNVDRLCRVCLQENTNLTPIFNNNPEKSSSASNLQEKLQICGGVDCHEQDGLPAMICDVCIYKASVAHEFRQLCQLSDNRLRLYYSKPDKYTTEVPVAQDNSKIVHLTPPAADDLQNVLSYVKSEAMNNQQFQTTLATEEYHPQIQSNSVVVPTIDAAMNNVNVNVSMSEVDEDKIFDCHLAFEEQEPKIVNKNSNLLTCDTQSVTCTQDLIPVTTLVDSVCNIESAINNVNNEEKSNYFTYITKEAMEALEDNASLEKEVEMSKKLPAENQTFESQVLEHNYFEPDSDNQSAKTFKFQCETCARMYNTKNGLRKHQLSHEKVYQCKTCFKKFHNIEKFRKHKKMHNIKSHTCNVCNATFWNPITLLKHLKSIHPDEDINTLKELIPEQENEIKEEMIDEASDETNVVLKSEENSMEAAMEENSVEANDNEIEIKNEDNEEKEDSGEPRIYLCEECSQMCSSMKNLKRHMLIHSQKRFSCTVCNKWFYRADTLKKHAERHGHGLLDNIGDDNTLYNSDDEGIPCKDGINKTGKGDEGKKDESEEENKGDYKCQHCDKKMTTKKGLRRHVAMHKPKPEPAVCEICKKVCASRARLALHQKTHNKPKEKTPREYLCHICSKVYPSNSSLTYHMRTHSGIKPHVCKTCNSSFTTTTSLANHIRIHTGDRPFVCHVCSAAFAVSSAFRRHLTRHTGEANYLCKTCGKAFKRLSTLKEHTYTHSGEKPYVCKTCGAAYSHSGSLFAHQKRCKAAQFTEIMLDDHHTMAHHIHVNNVQSAVRSLAVIGHMTF